MAKTTRMTIRLSEGERRQIHDVLRLPGFEGPWSGARCPLVTTAQRKASALSTPTAAGFIAFSIKRSAEPQLPTNPPDEAKIWVS